MKFDTRDVALTVVFTALYALINIAQSFSPFGNPSIYGPVQLRISDFLIALAALLGMPVVIGVTAGCVVVNMIGPIGPIDVIFGSLANLIAAGFVMLLRKHKLLACIVGSLPIGIIVGGGYLWMFYPYQPTELAFMPAWITTLISILVSSLIAIAVIGYIVLQIFSRPTIIEPLKSRGLKVLTDD
ncbi:MAG: QueT transporter family protein [Candidatus Bathyarchaeota archaeon]|nr:QueT transporter family protein [Candidatus Bathyarchaeota archaeon A05DMB-5]MDH7557051.1 QueT transporter family protein [Candidatus Bathyarchaeota archaeon]